MRWTLAKTYSSHEDKEDILYIILFFLMSRRDQLLIDFVYWFYVKFHRNDLFFVMSKSAPTELENVFGSGFYKYAAPNGALFCEFEATVD